MPLDLEQKGVWITPDCVTWGNWDDDKAPDLTDAERKALIQSHLPYSFSEEKARNIKRLWLKYSVNTIIKHCEGMSGYSHTSIKKITSALSRANSETLPVKSTSTSGRIDYQQLIQQ